MDNRHLRSTVSLHEHAAENLLYIRDAMERASSFTAVPGWGGVFMGLAGFAAAIIAPAQHSRFAWLVTWLATAAIAVAVGLIGVLVKARNEGVPLLSRPARQFALGFVPAIFVAALLTIVLFRAGLDALLPGMWLLLYGTAVIAGGTFSIRIVPLMGILFLFLGAIALFTAPPVQAVCLGLGFGGLHVVFGVLIARKYGG
ncbi:hypothetical protein ACFWZ1_06775 [Frateuria sp. GZRe14]|jgi:hypothetical protein|uniref:hypothetical protein n=1 Tax=Frateuria sp. GZRe14 TaxID=3351534 RepID=UPI003EDBB649